MKHSLNISQISLLWRAAIVFLALLINVTLAVRLLGGSQSIFAWKEMKAREVQLQEDLERVDAQRADLSRQIRLLQTDSEYVESSIRQRLNYVRKNEVLYLFNEQKTEDSHWVAPEKDAASNQ